MQNTINKLQSSYYTKRKLSVFEEPVSIVPEKDIKGLAKYYYCSNVMGAGWSMDFSFKI